jgi:hypothetical protein
MILVLVFENLEELLRLTCVSAFPDVVLLENTCESALCVVVLWDLLGSAWNCFLWAWGRQVICVLVINVCDGGAGGFS